MPDASGRFIGQGWSQAREDAWTRVFGPALADDPAYELDAATQQCCASGFPEVPCANCPAVPSEPSDEVQPDRDCPVGHGRCYCLPGSTSEAYCHAELRWREDFHRPHQGPTRFQW